MATQYQRPILNGRYEIHKPIDEGHTSLVYLGFDTRTQDYVAIKVIKNSYYYSDSRAQKNVRDEIFVMKSLNHNGIVKLYDYGC